MSNEKSRPYRGRPRSYKANGPAMQYYRERVGLTLEQLGQKSGVSYGQISRIETGITPSPRFGTIDQIAEALGVTRDDLLIYRTPPTPGITEENRKRIAETDADWDQQDAEEDNSKDDRTTD